MTFGIKINDDSGELQLDGSLQVLQLVESFNLPLINVGGKFTSSISVPRETVLGIRETNGAYVNVLTYSASVNSANKTFEVRSNVSAVITVDVFSYAAQIPTHDAYGLRIFNEIGQTLFSADRYCLDIGDRLNTLSDSGPNSNPRVIVYPVPTVALVATHLRSWGGDLGWVTDAISVSGSTVRLSGMRETANALILSTPSQGQNNGPLHWVPARAAPA